MFRSWLYRERGHAYVTKTHLRIGDGGGGRGWGEKTKPDVINGQSMEARNNRKVHSKRTKLFLIKNMDRERMKRDDAL